MQAEIKNLIFDLGGVILDLSVDSTLQAFAELSAIEKAHVLHFFKSSPGFNDYEKGLLTDAEFRQFVRALYKIDASDEQVDRCWNAMLRGIPKEKLSLLDNLKRKYKIFLLSNTNGIHLNYINNHIMPALSNRTLDSYFHTAYYSHQMKKRKPEAESYQQIIKENGLEAHETLFLDDNSDNIEGAKVVGLKTVFVDRPNLVMEYFKDKL